MVGLWQYALSGYVSERSLGFRCVVRASALRADSAHALVDLAIANPSFTLARVESTLSLSYGRARKLVGQLVDLGVLGVVDEKAYKRRYFAPRVVGVLSAAYE